MPDCNTLVYPQTNCKYYLHQKRQEQCLRKVQQLFRLSSVGRSRSPSLKKSFSQSELNIQKNKKINKKRKIIFSFSWVFNMKIEINSVCLSLNIINWTYVRLELEHRHKKTSFRHTSSLIGFFFLISVFLLSMMT